MEKPKPNTQLLLLYRTLLLLTLFTTTALFLHNLPIPHPLHQTPPRNPDHSLQTWQTHLRNNNNQTITTLRLGCREYDFGVQSCIYQGLICVNLSRSPPLSPPSQHVTRGKYIFIDDTQPPFKEVPSDNWCDYIHSENIADPMRYGQRHYPIWNHTIAPQMSCLYAKYHPASLLSNHTRIKWVPQLWALDFNWPKINHHNDLAIDIYWLLDVQLFQASLRLQISPALPGQLPHISDPFSALFGPGPKHMYAPHSRLSFLHQASGDINKLLWALVLQKNLTKLYPNSTVAQLSVPPPDGAKRWAVSIDQAYPELIHEEQVLFHNDLVADDSLDYVCAPSLVAGPKRADGASERVCRHMREAGWKLFGVPMLPRRKVGRINYQMPPKRVVVLHRHISRGFGNLEAVVTALKRRFRKVGVVVELVSTADLQTAEEFVRVFSRAGVVVSSHGSQNFGQIWMPRRSALIEVMPVGFTDYAFRMLSKSCSLWYYEIQSRIGGGTSREFYEERCGRIEAHILNTCNGMSRYMVWPDIDELVATVDDAFKRLGYEFWRWSDTLKVYEEPGQGRKRKGGGYVGQPPNAVG